MRRSLRRHVRAMLTRALRNAFQLPGWDAHAYRRRLMTPSPSEDPASRSLPTAPQQSGARLVPPSPRCCFWAHANPKLPPNYKLASAGRSDSTGRKSADALDVVRRAWLVGVPLT
jgi:hypothetical protein